MVDFSHIAHVTQTFFAIALRLLVIKDAPGKVVGLSNELRRVFLRVRLIDRWFAADLRLQMQPFVRECGLKAQGSLRPVHTKESIHPRTIRSAHGGEDAGGKSHRE